MQVSAAVYRPARPSFRPAPTLGVKEVWRDFGIHPLAMVERATIAPPPAPGSPLVGGVPGDSLTLDDLRGELKGILADLKDGFDDAKLRSFQRKFAGTAARYGVQVAYHSGAPRTVWGKFPSLEIYDQGGPSALHEMTHALQSCIGAVAGLSTEARERLVATNGRQPTPSELRQALVTLDDSARQAAFAKVVEPMETQAYARFEEGAFFATGMLGKKARDLDFFADRAGQNVDAFTHAYKHACVPSLDSGLDARIYGRIGHIARTHTETATLLGLAGYGYYRAATWALGVHPVAGALALVPLGCLIYRVVRG